MLSMLRRVSLSLFLPLLVGGTVLVGAPAGASDIPCNPDTPTVEIDQTLVDGPAISLNVVTPAYRNRYLRHRNHLAETSVINGLSPDLDKQDATFKLVDGRADSDGVSFESVNRPGFFLRHEDYRLKISPVSTTDHSSLAARDATFCVHESLAGDVWGDHQTYSFESLNYPGYFIRHRNAEVWLDPFVDAPSYQYDASWTIQEPF